MSKQEGLPSGTNAKLEVAINEIRWVKSDVTEIKKKLETDYVTRKEFDPIKSIVYGMVSLVLTSVLVGLIALVIKDGA